MAEKEQVEEFIKEFEENPISRFSIGLIIIKDGETKKIEEILNSLDIEKVEPNQNKSLLLESIIGKLMAHKHIYLTLNEDFKTILPKLVELAEKGTLEVEIPGEKDMAEISAKELLGQFYLVAEQEIYRNINLGDAVTLTANLTR